MSNSRTFYLTGCATAEAITVTATIGVEAEELGAVLRAFPFAATLFGFVFNAGPGAVDAAVKSLRTWGYYSVIEDGV